MAKRTYEERIAELKRKQALEALRLSARTKLDDLKTHLHGRNYGSALATIEAMRMDVLELRDEGAS